MERHQMGISRLGNQKIVGKTQHTAEEILKWMGAMQAQDYKQAVWAVGLRMNTTLKAVENAIAEAKILRTWSQRGTIHFVPAEDAKWMLQLCASRIITGHGRRMNQLELTDDIMVQSEKVIVRALSGKKIFTRAEIFALLNEARISTEGQRGYHILWHLAHLGVICIGPNRDKDQTFVLLEDWVPNLRQLTPDEALTELVWRYFSSHGPATDYDFARWSGLTLTDTRKGIHNNGSRLVSFKLADMTYWMSDLATPTSAQPVYLLPGFDEYLIGYQDRSAIITDDHFQKIVPGNNGVFKPMIVVDGQIIGTWGYKATKKSVDITLSPFVSIDNLADEIRIASESFSKFIELDVRIV